ncbi:MAG TPA: adenosine deaminase [Candidatus Krumholzibacteria bacterium]|nr:adenosine deaminase [Candidatus Krumholzibacteria bacterium]
MIAPASIPADLVRALPKTDLHLHLDGSLRLETMLELATEQGIRLPADDVDGLARQLRMGAGERSLERYLTAFDTTLSVLQEKEAIERCAYELAADCAAENVRYIEVRFSPILHTRHGLSLKDSVEAVRDGLWRSERELGIQTGIIICGIRHISPESSLVLAQLALEYKGAGVVGYDLAGAEEHFPAKKHREAFFLILNNNINCTVHAGEAFGPSSIAQAVHYCGAHRVGHGTRLREDPDLMAYVNDHRIALEMCLSSNVHTGAIQTLADHPIKEYLDAGLRVTLNTDNRLMSNTTLTNEFMLAIEHCGLTLHDIEDTILYGFKSAFLPLKRKKELLGKVYREIRALTAPYHPRGDEHEANI